MRKATQDEICEEFEIDPVDISFPLEPRYNIAPGQQAAVVVYQGRRRLEGMQWGLIPFWSQDPKIGYRLINARAETLANKPSFRNSLKEKRCLVVADGFYEWRREGGKKTPMFIRLKSGRPFGMAGLYDDWRSPDGKNLRTFTIITTLPNKLIASIHDRMPAILPREAYAAWLGQADKGEVLGLLRSFPEKEMEAWRVSPAVNSPRNEGPECIQPL